MIIFLIALTALILGYIFYGAFVEKVFKISTTRKTPAITCADGIDYVPLPVYKAILIQFLNIAGVGPVFGAILGALYGPICLLWIVFGSIFAGAVHDFLSGSISMRYKGGTMLLLSEKFFGVKYRYFFIAFISLCLILAGSIFAQTPAHILDKMTDLSFTGWLMIILGYYFLATILPIDKIIGKIYPVFALCLVISTCWLAVALFLRGGEFYPDLHTLNQNPKDLPIFPLMFITIACGAVSGFHSSQSPLMARCLVNEKYARPVFYGAMILEGIVALIWATLGIAFYHGTVGLDIALGATGDAGKVVMEVSKGLLGSWGGILTALAVVALTITSGDTALRSARLTCAEFFRLDQKNLLKRLALTVFVAGIAMVLAFIDLNKIWIYFGWANQMLATFMLWIGTLYLHKEKRNYWIALIPAIFMTTVCGTYLGYSPILFGQPLPTAITIGIAIAAFSTFWFFRKKVRKAKKHS